MRIAISGTPGTGKSTVAPLVAEELDYDLLDLNEFVKDHNLAEGVDEKRGSSIVDTDSLNDAISDDIKDNTVIDGHMAHQLDAIDLVIVLRADPEELEKRLQDKDWSDEKIAENVDAERLDVILQEAANLHPEATFEVDTTEKDPETTAKEIVYLVEHPQERSMYAPGGTDWELDPY